MTQAQQIQFCQNEIKAISSLIRSTTDRQLVHDLSTLASHYRETLQQISH
jgi:hypothetical protein